MLVAPETARPWSISKEATASCLYLPGVRAAKVCVPVLV